MIRKRKVGPYKLGELLGVGTVGTIFCATDTRNGRQVALKLLLPEVSGDEKIAARFKREMHILEKLDHPHIVRYYGGGKDGMQLYYAMELVEGGSIKRVLQERGRLEWPEAVEAGRQVCSALQHAHNHGIIHRDLKPANLFLTPDGAIKLGDFGIARDTGLADLTGSGITVGTYAYMAPEQIRGDRELSGKADLYSFGCVLFEMLTGRQPYLGENFAQIFAQHLTSTPPALSQLGVRAPRELAELVAHLLAKDPDERPFNARTVQATLMRLQEQHGRRPAPPDDGLDDPAAAEPPRPSLAHLTMASQAREVSWVSLAAIFLGIASLIGAAVYLQR